MTDEKKPTAPSGAVPAGSVPEIQKMISDFMVGFLDASQEVPHGR